MISQLKLGVILVLCLGSLVGADYSREVGRDKPVLWLRFDDDFYEDGMTATDVTRNVRAATYQGMAMTVVGGIGGRCGWFNGNQAAVDLADQLGAKLKGGSAITFEAWVRNSFFETDHEPQVLFASRINRGSAGVDVALISATDTKGYIRVAGRSLVSDAYKGFNTNFFSTACWRHVVCVLNYANDSIDVYLDGKLASSNKVDFASEVYDYLGDQTQTDRVGCAPDDTQHYRGHLDEVAVYNYPLSAERIYAHYASVNPQEPAPLWEGVIADDGKWEGPFLGSPGMCLLKSGTLVASHDYFGDNIPVMPDDTCAIRISYDQGKTWYLRSLVPNCVMANLFELDGVLYHFGITKNTGDIRIAKSTDEGLTWTFPTDGENGMLTSCGKGEYGYHTGPMPMVFANGRIYRVFEKKISGERWPMAYAAVMISADLKADLLKASSWTISNSVAFDSSWVPAEWKCTSPGWLEGNAVQAPDGTILAMMRVHTNPVVDKAAILTLSRDNRHLSYDPKTGLIDMPGGMHKFNIYRDPKTGQYLTLVNNNTDLSRPAQRNMVSLIASDDLKHWHHLRALIQDDSPLSWRQSLLFVGFQYVEWCFDGDDIIYMSRTAYDGANNYHNSNKMTFHRLENYLKYIGSK